MAEGVQITLPVTPGAPPAAFTGTSEIRLNTVLPPEQVLCGSNPSTARAHPCPHMHHQKCQRPTCDSLCPKLKKMCFPQDTRQIIVDRPDMATGTHQFRL